VLLEIREIHQASRQTFGYAVQVGGQTVHVRTYEELVRSPLTWFAAVERSLVRDPGAVPVTISSLGGGPFAIADIWGHGDFAAHARSQGLGGPLQISEALLGEDADQAATVRTRYPASSDYTYGVMLGSPYLDADRSELLPRLDGMLARSQGGDVPLAIMLSRWWAHTAMSLDGRGGAFSDVRYNQVTWDPVSRTFGLTTPNHWGNTCWPGMNSVDGNTLAQQRLAEASRRIADRYALLQALHGRVPHCDLVMEWGSGYWEGGDFSHEVVADARRDGVTLDPRDGLSGTEIAWMQLNIARYNHLLSEAYAQGLGTDAVVIRQGTVTEPQRQLAASVYSHCLQGQLYPSFDDRMPGWVGGIGPHMWSSSEMYEFVDQRHNEYSITYGPLACVNLEMTMLKGDDFPHYLLTSFANGMRFLVMFNQARVKADLPKQLLAASAQLDRPAPTPTTYHRQILDVDLLRDGQPNLLQSPPAGWTIAGLAHEPGHGFTIGKGYLCTEDRTKPGTITFPLADPDRFASGLLLELQGCTTSGAITVFAGTDEAGLRPAGTFTMGRQLTWFNKHARDMIDLSAIARGQERLVVRLELTGADTSVRAVRALLPWGRDCGPIGTAPSTWRERRLQSMWVQQRAAAQRAREDYVRKRRSTDAVTTEADRLMTQGRLTDATQLLQREISHLLPARFAIAGHGPLGRLPVEVRLPSASHAAVVEVLAMDATSIRFRPFSASAMNLGLRRTAGSGSGRIETATDGIITVTWQSGDGDGWVTVPLPGLRDEPDLAGKRIRGRVKGLSKTHLELEPWEGMRFAMSSAQRLLPLAPGCTARRRLATDADPIAAQPEIDDAVEVTLDDQSRIVAIDARRGLVTGTIATFEPSPLVTPDPHNGLIRLTDGQVFELSLSKDHSRLTVPPKLNGLALDYRISQLVEGLKPGLKVQVRYSPGQSGDGPQRIRVLTVVE